jgi:hypothetical protein
MKEQPSRPAPGEAQPSGDGDDLHADGRRPPPNPDPDADDLDPDPEGELLNTVPWVQSSFFAMQHLPFQCAPT